MKTTKILSAISAAALLGISSVALAQGTGSGSTAPGASGGAPSGSTLQRQEAPASGTMSKDSMSKDGAKSKQVQQGKEMGKDTQKSQAQDRTPGATDSKSKMSKDSAKEGAKSDTTVGAAPAGAVNLTTEQRTTIRQTVLTPNAPRASNVNFSVNVGTVVPSSVRVIAVPDTIVKINPRWKGYRYFVFNDEIIIVEPRTLKIVAVLDV
jgi:hypothetical protein